MIQRRAVKCAADGSVISEYYDDVSWVVLRRHRDAELSDTDWRFTSDQSPSDEWIAYRVFLRDLPQNHPGDNANDACDAWAAYEKPEGA